MAHRDDAGGSPWTVLKVLGVVLALLAMVGFGSCGLIVVALGASLDPDATVFLLGLGLIAVAVVALIVMLKIIKSTRREP